MVFSSVIFLFYFLPITLFLYFAVRRIKYKNIVLLMASMFFYAFGEPVYIFIMLASIAINYLSGVLIDKAKKTANRRIILVVSVILNIGIMVYFKYIDFFIDILNKSVGMIKKDFYISAIGVALPIGLSFFTFQGLSYVIDVYRRDIPPQKSFLKLALYISMFPQLVAGPIVRYKNIMDEIDSRKTTESDLRLGISRFIIGISKKVMIADILAGVADKAFSLGGQQLEPMTAWLGAICYMLQIYFDFSGYSDMAIGIGHILGFTFPENFDQPYTAGSVSSFWRKWHISLSGWFRDYLYIPLGGNRKGNVYINLLIVFICTGLWHGANYTFVFWGLWHGTFIIVERLLRNRGLKIKLPVVGNLYTLFVVLIGWVFFRAPGLGSGIRYIRSMFGVQRLDEFLNYNIWYYIDNQIIFTIIAAIIICTGIPAKMMKRIEMSNNKALISTGYVCLLLLFTISSCMIINGNFSPFIYFRF